MVSADTRAFPLLSTKWVIPPVRADALERERLHQRLDEALVRPALRLCVVAAPAGWGKTTLLSQWAVQLAGRTEARRSGRVAWLTLDEADNEPVRFWRYVLTALEGIGVGGAPLRALGTPGADPVSLALPLLVNLLADLEGRQVLVLDDYHTIADHRIHESVEFLLAYLPPSLSLVLAGRADPPLPLARMRARGQLAELRADDLAFDDDEGATLLAAVADTEVDAAASALVARRVEGWAAGLQLVGIALRGSPEPAKVAAEMGGADRHILDYLSTEVLDRLTAPSRDLLVRTSFLPRLCGPLCDAVTLGTGSADLLRELEAANLFVSGLDRHREWFRCHGLLQDVLHRELEASAAEDISVLIGRAAAWFAERGVMDEAARLRLDAGDIDGATQILRTHEQWFFDHGHAATYLDLGERIATNGAAADPQVALMLVYAAALTGRRSLVRRWYDVASPLIVDDGSVSIDGWHSPRASLLAMHAAFGHDERADPTMAVAEAQESVAREADAGLAGGVVARIALGSALARADREAEAHEVFDDAWQRAPDVGLPVPVLLQFAGAFALNLVRLRHLDQARQVLDAVGSDADRVESHWGEAAAASLVWIRHARGRLGYELGDMTAAVRDLTGAVALAEAWGRVADLVSVLTSLAQTRLAAGDGSGARVAMSRARELVDAEPVRRRFVEELERLEARVGRGAARAARRKGRLHGDLTDRELSILRLLPGSASQREIGEALYLSLNTVKGYTKGLYHKLGVSSRTDAVEQGRILGLI